MKKSPIALAVATAFGIGAAVDDAAAIDVSVTLVSAFSDGTMGSSAQIVSNSTATWSYNTSTGVVTGSGLYKAQTQINPKAPGQLFTHNFLNPVLGPGAATGTSYSCVEGSFGSAVYASLCGNYNYGANYANETSTSWSGLSASKTAGGDDVQLGPQQTVSYYDGMTDSWNGTTLIMSNGNPGTGGYTITFVANVVPVPAAAWLFGSALGLLGWARRRTAS